MDQLAPEISVVITTCSRAELLSQALASLLPQLATLNERGIASDLVVVDDGSTDSTPQLLAHLQQTSSVPIAILSGPRSGVAAARNLAAHHARGTWLASFDDDQIALPGWLDALYTLAHETNAPGIGGALLLHLPPSHTIDQLGPRTRSILGEHLHGTEPHPYPPHIHPATNNALIRRDVFRRLGGYDTSFTEGAEDADFFDRVEALGEPILFQPAAKALHLIPASRLEPRSLRWTSLRIGAGDARLHHRKRPYLAPLSLAAKRITVALVRDLPQLLWSALSNDARRQLDVHCSLWYTQGLLRALPAILASRPTSPFLRSLNFRTRNGERPPST